jgi:2-polyprenyl-6-methoxyphenol hydroxylase-like FAD-dependent oxidoreductase
MNDGWCDSVAQDGVVLIGDAAGWNDPIIGQGLAVSMRDARSVADIMCHVSDWTPQAFAPYAEERRERMRRLKIAAALVTALRCTFTPEGARRRQRWFERMATDPSLLAVVLAYTRGPETVPAETFEPANVTLSLSED